MFYQIISWFCHTNRWKLIHVRTKYILWNFEKLHFDVSLLLEIFLHFKHRVIAILFLISRSNHFYDQLLHLENSDLLISFSYPRVSIILAFYHCNYRLRQIIQLHVFSLSTCISCCIEGSKSLLSCVCSVKSLQIRKDYQRDNDMAKSCFFANFYSATPRVE